MFRFNSNPNRLLIRGLFAIAAGVVIVSIPGLTMTTVIQFMGGLLLFDAIINILISNVKSKKESNVFTLFPRGIGNLFLGAILILAPKFMVGMFVYLIGFLLLIGGISQLGNQLSGRSLFGFSWIYLIISIVATISGIVLITKTFESAQALMIFFGIIVAIYGVGEVFWSFKVRKIQKHNTTPTTIDTDYEEIDEDE